MHDPPALAAPARRPAGPGPQHGDPGPGLAQRRAPSPGRRASRPVFRLELVGGEGVAVAVHHQVELRVAPHQVATQVPVVEHLGARAAARRAPGRSTAGWAGGSAEVWGTATARATRASSTPRRARPTARAGRPAYAGRAGPAAARPARGASIAAADRHGPPRVDRERAGQRDQQGLGPGVVAGGATARRAVAASSTAKAADSPASVQSGGSPLGEVRRAVDPTAATAA